MAPKKTYKPPPEPMTIVGPTGIDAAIGGETTVKPSWMPVSAVDALMRGDPGVIWLEHFGMQHGFQRDSSACQMGEFSTRMHEEFAKAWLQHISPGAVTVCATHQDLAQASFIEKTRELMIKQVPVIHRPALWWAPESLYGMPDLLVHSSWIARHFPGWGANTSEPVNWTKENGYRVVLFSLDRKLEDYSSKPAFGVVRLKLQLHTFMLAHLQGISPPVGFVICPDRVFRPVVVPFTGPDQTIKREHVSELVSRYKQVISTKSTPWEDTAVQVNPLYWDDGWNQAKQEILQKRAAGGDLSLLHRIGVERKKRLRELGYSCIHDLLAKDPADIELESIQGLWPKYRAQIRSILTAQRSGQPSLPSSAAIPVMRPHEFFVQFSCLSGMHLNVNTQWPQLDGCPMLYMISVGYSHGADVTIDSFVAKREHHEEEKAIVDGVLAYAKGIGAEQLWDPTTTAFFHWNSVEGVIESVAGRSHQSIGDSLRQLPRQDLRTICQDDCLGLPGAYTFDLGELSSAVARIDSAYDPKWPDWPCDQNAAVMAWKAYEQAEPLNTAEMKAIQDYSEAHCRALWNVLRFLRSHVAGTKPTLF